MAKHDRLLRQPEVLALTGMSPPTLWRWEKRGLFPCRVKIGGWSVAWRLSEVEAWIARQRPAMTSPDGATAPQVAGQVSG